MKVRLLTLCCVGLLTWSGPGQAVQAQGSPPPIGTWGNTTDGFEVVLAVGENGDAHYSAGGMSVTGRWTWSANSTGGIITIHYVVPATGNRARLYYSISRRGRNQIVMSDPNIRLIMTRR